MIFEPHLLPQLNGKRDKREKCMKINVKPPIKLLREVKQTVLIVGEGGYPVLQLREENQTFAIIKGGKVDFSPCIMKNEQFAY